MKRSLQLFFFILTILCCTKMVSAQYVFVPDQTGKPLTETRYENLTGTPYLIDQWTNGEVKLPNGQIIKPKALKYDQVNDKLLFQENGRVYEFFPKALSFSLHTDSTNYVFLLKDKDQNQGYYEVLSKGKIVLLKKTKKTILEVKGYNSANIEKIVDENKKYFIVGPNLDKEIKLNKKSLIDAIPQYKTQIDGSKLDMRKQSAEKTFIELIQNLNNE